MKKIMLVMILCLIVMPTMASYASSGDSFVSERDAKILTHNFQWSVVIYKVDGEKRKKVYEETLDSAIAQKDGSYLSFSEKVTVLEPKTSNKSKSIIILRIKNIEVDNKKYSETFTFENGKSMYYLKSSDKNLSVMLCISPIKGDTGRDRKPNAIFY